MHEQLGVTMFLHEAPKDEFNPDGYYEDVAITNINEYVMRGKCLVTDLIGYIEGYEREVLLLKKPWGVKDARIAMLGAIYKYMFPNANIIFVKRNEDLVIKSLQRKYSWTIAACQNHINHVKIYNEVIWKDRIWASLDMTEKRTDDEIKTAILERTREL